MENEKKKKSNKKLLLIVIPMIIGGLIGGFAGFFGAEYFDRNNYSWMEIVCFLIGVIVAIYLQIIVHEGGHLILGLLTGYRFVSFRVESFILYKKQGKFHVGRYALAGTGGQCLMAPPAMQDGTMPYILYNFGGVIMNLIVSIGAFVLFRCFTWNSFMKGLYLSVIFIGIVFAITNGIPMHVGGIDNDGYNALTLGKHPEALRALWLQLKVNEMQTEGVRLKDMPEEWFQKPTEEEMQNSLAAAIEAMRCNRLMDMQLLEETNQAIGEVVQSKNAMIGLQKMLLQIDQVFCEILGEKRESILAQFKDKEIDAFMKSMKNFPSVLRTQYAYALVIENDAEKAEKLKKQLEKITKNHPFEGEVESEWEFVRLCEQSLMKQ